MRRSPFYAGAAVLALGLTFGGGVGVAFAAGPPAPDTAECTAAVLAAPGVTTAQAALTAASPTAQNYAELQQAVVNAKSTATTALCTGTAAVDPGSGSGSTSTGSSTTGGTSTGSSTSTGSTTPCPTACGGSTPVATVTVASVRAQIDALSCGPTFNHDQGAVDDGVLSLVGHAPSAEVGALLDREADRLAALNYCTTSTNTSSPRVVRSLHVAPCDDNGSVAVISHHQVTDVPEGNAQTGAV